MTKKTQKFSWKKAFSPKNLIFGFSAFFAIFAIFFVQQNAELLQSSSVYNFEKNIGGKDINIDFDSGGFFIEVLDEDDAEGDGDLPGCQGENCMLIPDTAEYAGIATETSLRKFIQTWVNFFLGFLSLVAMVFLVYAGFLYVTAGGDDDQTGKAKNIILYTVIGIVVIFAAYAIVNTLISYGPTSTDVNPDGTIKGVEYDANSNRL